MSGWEERFTAFKLVCVKRKDGVAYNRYHDEVIGQKCLLVSLNLGECALLGVEFKSDPGIYSPYRTTPVISINREDDWSEVEFETFNTMYKLVKLDDEGDTLPSYDTVF